MALADQVVVMNHGRIEQDGTPREVFNAPRTEFVARFIGGAQRDRRRRPAWSRCAPTACSCSARRCPTARTALPATVRGVEYQGTYVQLTLGPRAACADAQRTPPCPKPSSTPRRWQPGDSACARWDPADSARAGGLSRTACTRSNPKERHHDRQHTTRRPPTPQRRTPAQGRRRHPGQRHGLPGRARAGEDHAALPGHRGEPGQGDRREVQGRHRHHDPVHRRHHRRRDQARRHRAEQLRPDRHRVLLAEEDRARPATCWASTPRRSRTPTRSPRSSPRARWPARRSATRAPRRRR